MEATGKGHSYKIITIGESGVGKSALLCRLVDNTFNEGGPSTVGVEFKPHNFDMGDHKVRLQIWDTAGQERFRTLTRAYFRNAVGAILVFDLTNESSFENLGTWLNILHEAATPNACIVLVGNKSDLERQVSSEAIRHYAETHKIEYIETSAKLGSNVNEAVRRLVANIEARVSSGEIKLSNAPAKASPFEDKNSKTKQGCC